MIRLPDTSCTVVGRYLFVYSWSPFVVGRVGNGSRTDAFYDFLGALGILPVNVVYSMGWQAVYVNMPVL